MKKLKNKKYQDFRKEYNNKSLEDFVTKANNLNFIDEEGDNLIQIKKAAPYGTACNVILIYF